MDQETLFTPSKWDILKLLAEQPLSPLELTQRSKTSLANIIQNLPLRSCQQRPAREQRFSTKRRIQVPKQSRRTVAAMNKQWTFCAIITLGILLCAGIALAQPASPTSLTTGASSSRNLSTLTAQSVTAQAGNMTPLNITALAITKSWQGYYGNITGTIILADVNNKTFYNWSATSVLNGRIFATRNSSVAFTSVNCTNATGITNEIAALGQTATDADSVSNTFTLTAHPQFYVGSVNIAANTCKSTNAFGPTGAQASQFYQILLSDANGAGNIIYTTIANGTQTGFNNLGWNFELLVGQNGHQGGPATTPYYFYVELT